MAAASRRCLSSSCSLANACCFLFPLSSVDLDLRNKIPNDERRGAGCCGLPASEITVSLSFGDPAFGDLGLLDETMFNWV